MSLRASSLPTCHCEHPLCPDVTASVLCEAVPCAITQVASAQVQAPRNDIPSLCHCERLLPRTMSLRAFFAKQSHAPSHRLLRRKCSPSQRHPSTMSLRASPLPRCHCERSLCLHVTASVLCEAVPCAITQVASAQVQPLATTSSY